jgi:hypothetical protein
MKNIIKFFAVAAAVIAGAQVTKAYAQSNQQCDFAIPASGDLNLVCDPVTPNLLGRGLTDDPANGSGINYNYQVRVDQGGSALAVLLDSVGNRTRRSVATGGGQCPNSNDGPGVDGSFGALKSCNLLVANSATIYRVGINF